MPFRLLAVLALCVFPACEPEPPADADALTFTDDLGRTVILSEPAQRLVPLAPNLTEIIFAAEADDRLAAVTTADDFPPGPLLDSLPRVAALPVDFERIAALKPDLVLATDQVNNPRDAETFAALDVPVVFLSFTDVASIFDAVEKVGTLAGTEDEAQRAADSLRTALDHLRARTAELERPRVLLLIGDEALYAFGEGSYVHTLIEAAGGESVTAEVPTAAPVLSEEFVLAQDPDVIVGTWGEGYDTDRLVELHPAFASLEAVQQGRVYSVASAPMLRPGPRVVGAAEDLARRLHPALSDTTTEAL